LSYILHICSWFPHEGDPQNGVFIRQHIELTQDSFQPIVICNTPRGKKHIDLNNFEILNLQVARSKWQKIRRAKKLFKQLLKEKGSPKAIHLHVASPLGAIALLATKILKAQLILTEHWTGYRSGLYQKSSYIQKLVTKKVFEKASKVLVVSESLKSDILAHKLIDAKKIIVNPNPIAFSITAGDNENLRQNGINMLSVADFNEKNKNFFGILKAFENCLSQNPTLHWTIIGDGPDKVSFEQLLNSSTAKDNVHLLGRKPQAYVHQHLSQFDFLVSFSRFETFAMVPAEAIAAGIPVIATKSGGPEYYINSNNGILIESENISQLQEAINTMCSSFHTYPQQKIKNSLPNTFSPKHFSETLIKLYNKK
jgi:glycosyltransferase involved in cell wall biosynthesis